jgi:phosphatidate cytidylyltransferase
MGTRIATAAIGIPIVAYAIAAGNPWPLRVLLLAIGLLMAVEFARAEGNSLAVAVLYTGFAVAVVIWSPLAAASAWIVALNAVPVIEWVSKETPRPILFAGWVLLPLLTALSLRAASLPPEATWSISAVGNPLLLLVLCLWAGDSMAYFIGRSFGKRKLAPKTSPNKTWEGGIANLVACLIVGWAFAGPLELPTEFGIALGAVAGVLGQIGDLFQSLWKRRNGAKDSGSTLPGHGGMLDRFDSLLFTLPAANALAHLWRL